MSTSSVSSSSSVEDGISKRTSLIAALVATNGVLGCAAVETKGFAT
jgi:hypothetical protein